MPEPTKAECHAMADEICRGNRDARAFCDCWYQYCHGIDDLLDTRLDGRPTVSAEFILHLFATAALLYNCPFFVAHRQHLFPLVITITNMYADSVAWEKSPLERQRAMADVLRTCGDEMLLMVAMLTGGWEHMRTMSVKLRDRDWVLQHDSNGKWD